MVKVAPSFLSADFLHLSQDVQMANEYADLFHMDVMDGVQVPNISIGFPIVKAVASMATKPLDVHLMIVEPGNYALKFAEVKGVEMVSFHLEACPEPDNLLEELRSRGKKAGLAVNPDFPLEKLFPHLKHCDFVLIMSVFAGFGGQKFIEESYARIKTLRAEIVRQGLDVEIEVDGGVNTANAPKLVDAGVNILVAGTSVFGAADRKAAIDAIRGFSK